MHTQMHEGEELVYDSLSFRPTSMKTTYIDDSPYDADGDGYDNKVVLMKVFAVVMMMMKVLVVVMS